MMLASAQPTLSTASRRVDLHGQIASLGDRLSVGVWAPCWDFGISSDL